MPKHNLAIIGDLHWNEVFFPVSGEKSLRDDGAMPDHRTKLQKANALKSLAHPGGVWLLDAMLAQVLGGDFDSPACDTTKIEVGRFPTTMSLAKLYPQNGPQDKKHKVLRLERFLGWRQPPSPLTYLELVNPIMKARLDWAGSHPLDVCMICDMNLGFFDQGLDCLNDLQAATFVLHLQAPAKNWPQWSDFLKRHGTRTVAVVSAKALREEGIKIAFNSSVEQATADFVREINHPVLMQLRHCDQVVVRFKHGSMRWEEARRHVSCVYTEYFSKPHEDPTTCGAMTGHALIHLAAIAESIAKAVTKQKGPFDDLADGIRKGVVLSQWHFWDGYGKTDPFTATPHPGLFDQHKTMKTSWDELKIKLTDKVKKDAAEFLGFYEKFSPEGTWTPENRQHVETKLLAQETAKKLVSDEDKVLLKNAFALAETTNDVSEIMKAAKNSKEFKAWAQSWTRVERFLQSRELKPFRLASAIVHRGLTAVFGDTKEAFDSIFEEPRQVVVNRFGKMQTVDRLEIEQYTALQNVLGQYLSDAAWKEPLSIAVFGPPGSGKSFAVNQILASLDDDASNEPMEFNLSQFESLRELASAFHRVQDLCLGLASKQGTAQVPLIFFDEFDCRFEHQPLGFLKYFLGPMQDGKYRDDHHNYRVGKAIFVFAGGLAHRFEEFRTWSGGEFRNAKGPDFVSRLRGFLDVAGANPSVVGDSEAQAAEPSCELMIRRAVLLRHLLEKRKNEIIDERTKFANIDPDLLRAFLQVPRFQHGTRSMEAVLQMSGPLRADVGFQKAFLPPADQLNMHVDSQSFLSLMDEK